MPCSTNPEVKYEIRYPGGAWYCILWVSVGQNIFVLKDWDAWQYQAVKDFENGRRFSSIEELYQYVYAGEGR